MQQIQDPVFTIPQKDAPKLDIAPPQPAAPSGDRTTKIRVQRLRIEGATVFPESVLLQLVQEELGKDLTLDELYGLAERITRHYQQAGYVLSRAYLPAQDVKDGLIRVAVLEGRLGEVELQNRSRLSDQAARQTLSALQQGMLVEERALERSLLLLNDLPGISAGSTLRAGRLPGTSDLLVQMEQVRAAEGVVSLDNHGSRYTGAMRLSGFASLNNPFQVGDQLSARVLSAGDSLNYVRLSYQVPVWRPGIWIRATRCPNACKRW